MRTASYCFPCVSMAALLLLAACGGGHSAPERYTLNPEPVAGPSCPTASIKIVEPSVAPGLDSWRIAVRDRPHHITTYRGVAWSANASRMVQHALADMLSQAGMFQNVSTDLDTVASAYTLESTLDEFNTDLTGPEPVLRIRLTASLVRPGGQGALTIPLEREAAINGLSMDAIVALFNTEMHSIGEELATNLGTAISACR